MALPGVFANKFTVAMADQVTRIEFGEQWDRQATIEPRAVAVMSTTDAVELAQLILKLHGTRIPPT